MRTKAEEGTSHPLPAGRKWERMQVFGRSAYVSRDVGLVWIAMRIGNIPIGVPFVARGAWGIIDVQAA